MATKRMSEFDDPTPKKKAKSVFNKPMREVVKKPAKKIPVKIVQKPSPVEDPLQAMTEKGISASINLRFVVNSFKIAHGEQDVNRANLNLFLADLDAAINKVSAVFEP